MAHDIRTEIFTVIGFYSRLIFFFGYINKQLILNISVTDRISTIIIIFTCAFQYAYNKE